MANLWANRARSYYREYRPTEYQAIPDKETFFRELGETAAAQTEAVYRQIGRNSPISRWPTTGWRGCRRRRLSGT
jgi:hypothetical protein